jgi:hypothetical protein
MAAPKTGARSSRGRQARPARSSPFTTVTFFIRLDQTLPKGTADFRLNMPGIASEVLTSNPMWMKVLLKAYGDAIAMSRTAGRRVSFRVDVDPEGETAVTHFDEAFAPPEPEAQTAPNSELQAVLAAARHRGRLRAEEILGGDDMLSTNAFAKMLGTTRTTVNAKRQSGQVLGLDGAKRGFRFPLCQLNAEGKPYAELGALHERLGGPWAVYRFLVQPHGELGGLTGREALERGKVKDALDAAETVGRDFR